MDASPFGLVLINYELITEDIREAAAAYNAGDLSGFDERLARARELLNVLMTTLDMSYDISGELMRVYIYVNGLLIKAGVSRSPGPAVTAGEIMEKILAGLSKAEETYPDADAVMKNAQVFAGLTYKNGRLSEYIDTGGDAERGFKA